MRSLIILSVLVSFSFFGCETSPSKFNEILNKNIEEAEVRVNDYDAAVQEAVNSGDYEIIDSLSIKTLKLLTVNLENIQRVNSKVENSDKFKEATEAYMTSLMDFVKTQAGYALMTNATDSLAAANIDNKSLSAIKNVEQSLFKFREYQKIYTQSKHPDSAK